MSIISASAFALLVIVFVECTDVPPVEQHDSAGKFLQVRSHGREMGGSKVQVLARRATAPAARSMVSQESHIARQALPLSGLFWSEPAKSLRGSAFSYLSWAGLFLASITYITLVFGSAIYYRCSRGVTETPEEYLTTAQMAKRSSNGSPDPSLRSFQTLAAALTAESLERDSGVAARVGGERDFSDGLFDVSSDWSIFAWSCFCPCIRWADTVSKLFFISFFMGVSMWATLLAFDGSLSGLGFCFLVIFGASNRIWIRSELGMTRRLGSDCLAFLCCMPCAVAQEARHVDRLRGLLPSTESSTDTQPCYSGTPGQANDYLKSPSPECRTHPQRSMRRE